MKPYFFVILLCSLAIQSMAQTADLPKIVQPPKYADGRFYLTLSEFENTPAEKQAHILKNPSVYVVIPNGATKPKTLISRQEFEVLSPAKQKSLLDSNAFEIAE